MDKKAKISISAFQAIFFLSLFILYAVPSAGRFFYRDDFAAVFWSRIGSLGDLWRVIGQPLPGNVFYRPVGNLSYSLDWALWGPNAFMYFLHSILWQLFSIYLIYKIIKLMTGNEYVAVLSEALFLLFFPLNSGSVSLLSNRHAVIAITFCLLSFYYFFKMRLGKGNGSASYPLSILFFALAVFTKELSVPLILVFMVADILYFRRGKTLWIHYLPYLAVLVLRYFAGAAAKVASPFGGTASDYSFVFGVNMLKNLVYYVSWLILPAAVVVAVLYILCLMNGLKIEREKAFPVKISLFALSFALINLLPYLPFAEYRQLGWLHMSTIGMAVFLASPTYYFLSLLSAKPNVKRTMILFGALIIVFFVAVGAVFLPSKLILRNRQAGYSKQFIRDFVKLKIRADRTVYVVDIGSKDYRLSDTFISPMAKKDVLYEAIYLFMRDKAPKEIHLADKAADIRKAGPRTVILFYRDGQLSRH
jgi:hypothetical protein